MKTLRQNLLILIITLCTSLALAACNSSPAPTAQPPALSTNTPAPVSPAEVEQSTPTQLSPLVEPAEIEPIISSTFISVVGDETVVEGALSTLSRMEHGLYMAFDTADLVPGEAYTMWWVIFNKPENCSDGACGLGDIVLLDENGERLYADDGAPLANFPQREATQFSLLRATGSIVDEDGTAEFRAHLTVGDAYEAAIGPGLLDAMGAEVHLISRTHGPAIPGLIHEQMNTPWGGCPEVWPKTPCADTQFAVHSPSQE